MNKLGMIRNISGYRTWSSASLCHDEGRYFLVNNNDSVNLTDYLENVSREHHTKTSIGGVLGRTFLGGIAGLNWARGNAGISGAAVGLGSSISTEYQNIFVTLTFIDGDFIQGQTDLKTATLLEAISGQSTGVERVQSLQEHEKYMRFLRDAPRTYYEVRDEISALESQLPPLEEVKDNGSNFDEREKARIQYLQIQQTIDNKKTLFEDLEYRAKAIKAFGDFDLFLEQESPLRHKYSKLEHTLYDVKIFKKWHFYVLLISFIAWAVGASSEEDADMATFYSSIILLFIVYYITRYLFRLIMKGPRQRKLLKLEKEYDEKCGLNNITL